MPDDDKIDLDRLRLPEPETISAKALLDDLNLEQLRLDLPTDAEAKDRSELFSGNFDTEKAALDAFDATVERSGLFTVRRQVRGCYTALRPGRDERAPRIDRLLFPTQKARDLQWDAVIGIEAKRSREKLGRAVCQALDYTWAEFDVDGEQVRPSWIGLWPLGRQTRAIASVMTQNRLMSATPMWTHGFGFDIAGSWLLLVDAHGDVCSIRADLAAIVGHKTGTR